MSALEDIKNERLRQIEVEGWTHVHDDGHDSGELAEAAACYAALEPIYYIDTKVIMSVRGHRLADVARVWPWDEPIKRDTASRRRELVKAAALILAEIERLDRLSNSNASAMED